jgi:hypothetical protein
MSKIEVANQIADMLDLAYNIDVSAYDRVEIQSLISRLQDFLATEVDPQDLNIAGD